MAGNKKLSQKEEEQIAFLQRIFATLRDTSRNNNRANHFTTEEKRTSGLTIIFTITKGKKYISPMTLVLPESRHYRSYTSRLRNGFLRQCAQDLIAAICEFQLKNRKVFKLYCPVTLLFDEFKLWLIELSSMTESTSELKNELACRVRYLSAIIDARNTFPESINGQQGILRRMRSTVENRIVPAIDGALNRQNLTTTSRRLYQVLSNILHDSVKYLTFCLSSKKIPMNISLYNIIEHRNGGHHQKYNDLFKTRSGKLLCSLVDRQEFHGAVGFNARNYSHNSSRRISTVLNIQNGNSNEQGVASFEDRLERSTSLPNLSRIVTTNNANPFLNRLVPIKKGMFDNNRSSDQIRNEGMSINGIQLEGNLIPDRNKLRRKAGGPHSGIDSLFQNNEDALDTFICLHGYILELARQIDLLRRINELANDHSLHTFAKLKEITREKKLADFIATVGNTVAGINASINSLQNISTTAFRNLGYFFHANWRNNFDTASHIKRNMDGRFASSTELMADFQVRLKSLSEQQLTQNLTDRSNEIKNDLGAYLDVVPVSLRNDSSTRPIAIARRENMRLSNQNSVSSIPQSGVRLSTIPRSSGVSGSGNERLSNLPQNEVDTNPFSSSQMKNTP